MEDRRALLIGIPGCDNPELFEPIPEKTVRADITRMARALGESGYEVTVLGVRPDDGTPVDTYIEEPPTKNTCLDAIQTACGSVPEGGTLVIYFSGHGVRVGGADYLVPKDVSRPGPDGGPNPRRLIPVNFVEEPAQCKARTVVCFIDACRDPAKVDSGPRVGMPLPELPGGSFVLVRGCSPEETCRWDVEGSVFTRALARALQRHESPRTLGEVLSAVKARLREQEERQTPKHSSSVGEDDDAVLDAVICDSVDLLADWQTAVTAAPLWSLVPETENVDTLKIDVRELVAELGTHIDTMRTRLRDRAGLDDPWTDDAHPARVLDNLFALLRPAGAGHRPNLSGAEAGVLVAAPFLREAVLALGLYDVPDIDALNFTRTFGEGLRSDLENVFANQEQLARRAAGSGDRNTLAMWLVHSWILEREELWEGHTVAGWAGDLARSLLAHADQPTSAARCDALSGPLRTIVRCLTTSLGPPADPDAFDGVPTDLIRPRALGFLLSIAGVLAADPRRMSSAVADHIGTHDPVRLDRFQQTLSADLVWKRDGDTLELDAFCDHPAVHAVLIDLAEEADSICATAIHHRDRPKLHASEGALLANIPVRCNHNLRPDRDAYEEPLTRFHLASDRVRDLLMGVQLYGDPSVAVRELYQNGLDACRYRHMRLRHDHRSDDIPGWQGGIVFRQGIDAQTGRAYIECEDNGVGMTEAVLRDVFTAAGTRFVHTQAFRREEAKWRRADPSYRLYPNSQFGIGAFSYFMLADEISMWTVATDERGAPAAGGLHIHIPGPGGLFRIRRNEQMPPGIRNGGTLIRLHLTDGQKVDCAKTLDLYLVVSEYAVRVESEGDVEVEWSPAVPRVAGRQPAVASRPAADQFWWVDGPGTPLSDGLWVGSDPKKRWKDSWCYGRIVNLAGPQLPQLNVERTSMLGWDRSWVSERERESIRALADWDGFTWPWLWKMTTLDVDLAQRIFDELADVEIGIAREPNAPRVTVGVLGCMPTDGDAHRDLMFGPQRRHNQQSAPIDAWRRSLLRSVLADAAREHRPWGAEPVDVTGYPVVSPTAYGALMASGDSPVAGRFTVPDLLFHLRSFALAGEDLRNLRYVDVGDEPILVRAALLKGQLQDRIFEAANELGRGLGDIVDLFRPLAVRHGIELPPVDPAYRHMVPTKTDLRLLSRELNGQRPWLLKSFSLTRIRYVSNSLRLPVEDVLARLDRLAGAGLSVPRVAAIPRDEIVAQHHEAVVRIVEKIVERLDPFELTPLAHTMGVSERDALAAVVRAAESFGLTLDLSSVRPLPESVPSDKDVSLSTRFVHDLYPAALADVLIERHENLVEYSRDEAVALYRRNAHMFDLPPVVMGAHLAQVAAGLRSSVGHALDRMGELFDGWLDLSEVTGLPDDVLVQRPDEGRRAALLTDGTRAEWKPLTAEALAKLAHNERRSIGDLLESLAPYRHLGADIPTVTGDLAAYRPDEYDEIGLGIAMPADEPGPVTPLRLLRVAGRFGWTVRHAHGRLARFAPFGLELTVAPEACPDTIVHWADLIVVTPHLDGYDPALTGRVTTDQIQRAADAVRETPARTRDRLAHHAALFGYDLEETA